MCRTLDAGVMLARWGDEHQVWKDEVRCAKMWVDQSQEAAMEGMELMPAAAKVVYLPRWGRL